MTSYRNVNEALPSLARDLLDRGVEDDSRAGKTKELTFQHFTIRNPLEREILVAGRSANLAAQIAETMWVLSGRNDIEWLSAYLPRAAEFSDDGKTWRAGYGPRLRHWQPWQEDADKATDQLQHVIGLLLENPGTRRAVMSIFDPALDYRESKDIPCNNWLHFLARGGVLDLHVAIRSNDLVWGWSGINQFEWSTLLEVVAAYTGLEPGSIHYAVSSLHMYDRHWGKAESWAVSHPVANDSPRFDPDWEWDKLCSTWFAIEEGIRQGIVTDATVNAFPEPMLRSWLWVLQWWWTGDEAYLRGSLEGSRLARAALLGTGPRKAPPVAQVARTSVPGTSPFIEQLIALHADKHESYGDSWKRRGEMLAILANIARKVDRLGGSETADETSADTAGDLLVYLAKYRAWLDNWPSDDAEFGAANDWLRAVDGKLVHAEAPSRLNLEEKLRGQFNALETIVVTDQPRAGQVEGMMSEAYLLARMLWHEHQQRLEQRDAALRQVPDVLDSETHYRGARP